MGVKSMVMLNPCSIRSSFPMHRCPGAGRITSRYGSELSFTDWIHPQTNPELGPRFLATGWTVALGSDVTGYIAH